MTGSRHNEFMLHDVTKESKKNFDDETNLDGLNFCTCIT
jgi:hypothetical protein